MAETIEPKVVVEQTDALHAFVADLETECCELPGCHFDFDSTFVMPEGMRAIGTIAEAIRASHPIRKAAVFGHTDAVGDEQYNKLLSEQRARIVHAALTHDVRPWEERYKHENWGTRVIQVMLNAVDPDAALAEDGIPGPLTRAATKRFQSKHGLVQDGIAGPITRKSLFTAYVRLQVPEPVDGGRFLTIGGSPFMGCGEFNPFTEEVADAASRRAVVLLVPKSKARNGFPCALGSLAPCRANTREAGATPEAGDPTPHYRCRVYRKLACRCPCGPTEPLMPFELQIHDYEYRPCGDLEYRLELPSGRVIHGRTDGSGWLRNAVPRGRQTIQVCYQPANYDYELTLPVRLADATDDSDEALLGHLYNIGFGRGDEGDRQMLLRFQKEKGLPLTGTLDADTRAAVRKAVDGDDDSLLNELGD